MSTIKDVAKLAGVALSTASNALNGKYGVNPQTKKRVLEAAKELNYIPNPIAQGLVSKSMKNIGIIVSGFYSSFSILDNPVLFELTKSIALELNEGGYNAILRFVSMDQELQMIPELARNRSVDAMILVGTRRSDFELEKLLQMLEIPTLLVIRSAPNKDTYAVSADNKGCGYKAARYLIEMGHRTIGFIGLLSNVSMAEERLEGYRQALYEADISFDQSLVAPGDYFQESGLMAVRQLLRQTRHRPTAIFAANDVMALGAMEGIFQEGFRIPEDISLIGSDNIPNLHLLKTPLTTVATPYSKMGSLAARKIIGILTGNDETPPQIVLEAELRIRNSVGKLTVNK